MRIMFLDVDGVFNRWDRMNYITLRMPDQFLVLEETTVKVFRHYLSRLPADVKIVVSSSWRVMFEDARDFANALGFPIERMHEDWRTYTMGGDSGNGRAVDINAWLFDHPDVTKFVVVDDVDFCFDEVLGEGHFVHTTSEVGLTMEDISRIFEILGEDAMADEKAKVALVVRTISQHVANEGREAAGESICSSS